MATGPRTRRWRPAPSAERLAAWFQALDRKLKATLEALSEEEIQNKVIDRGGGFVLPPLLYFEKRG